MSNTLSRILQTVDDVSFRVVDVKKNSKRRKKIKITNDVEVQGDSTFLIDSISKLKFRLNRHVIGKNISASKLIFRIISHYSFRKIFL